MVTLPRIELSNRSEMSVFCDDECRGDCSSDSTKAGPVHFGFLKDAICGVADDGSARICNTPRETSCWVCLSIALRCASDYRLSGESMLVEKAQLVLMSSAVFTGISTNGRAKPNRLVMASKKPRVRRAKAAF